jgi:hypothetical protein
MLGARVSQTPPDIFVFFFIWGDNIIFSAEFGQGDFNTGPCGFIRFDKNKFVFV